MFRHFILVLFTFYVSCMCIMFCFKVVFILFVCMYSWDILYAFVFIQHAKLYFVYINIYIYIYCEIYTFFCYIHIYIRKFISWLYSHPVLSIIYIHVYNTECKKDRNRMSKYSKHNEYCKHDFYEWYKHSFFNVNILFWNINIYFVYLFIFCL